LSELIENISESNEMDIAEHVDALVKITTAKPPLEEKNKEMEERKTEGRKSVDETVLSVEQDLISTNADDLKQKLQATLVNNPSLLILDLSKVEHVDSIGIGLIIATFNTLKRQDGTLKLINLNSNLLNLLKTMRLDRHIEMEGTI
jgi:anti-anti-sigma factor